MKHAKPKYQAPVCPYCGRRSILRDASAIYTDNCYDPSQKLYVCPGYPVCDSYVGAHAGSLRPKGTLANGQLRNRRIMAHHAFDQVWKQKIMTRKEAYRWLQDITGLSEGQAHIAMFSDYRCDQVIKACEQVMRCHNRQKGVA